jgi:DNA-binding IclR family transcriptional regulator
MVLLACFTADDLELSLGELSRRSGIPKPTVHRLARELIRAGMLEASPAGVRLGELVFELGQITPQERLLREVASPFLNDLLVTSRAATVHLAVLSDGDVLYLDKLVGREAPALPSRVGGRLPAHCTALGKVLLAYSSEAAVRRRLSLGLDRQTPRTVTAPGILGRQLSAAREQGYAVESEEAQLGVQCIASPIFHHDGTAIAAISMATPIGAGSVNDISRRVLGTAKSINDRLHRAARARREHYALPKANLAFNPSHALMQVRKHSA